MIVTIIIIIIILRICIEVGIGLGDPHLSSAYYRAESQSGPEALTTNRL